MEKYSSVIMERQDKEEFLANLQCLAEAFKNSDFREIIAATNISNAKKIDFIVSFCKYKKEEFINFIKILMLNRRLSIIPTIYQNLLKKIALEKDVFYAKIFTKEPLSSNDLGNYEEKLTKYFSKNIKLENELCSKEEVRVYIEDLGYEIVVSNDMLKQKLKEFITKVV